MNRSRMWVAGLCLVVAGAFGSLVASPTARGENWPQWRGPRLDGTSLETDVPIRWSRTENVAWRVPMPGQGGSTPAVWDDRIFVTSADDQELVLLCIGTDGQLRWRRVIGHGDEIYRIDEGNNASPSPCTDGEYVWSCMSNGFLACHTVDGDPVWQCNLQDRYGAFDIQFGLSSTPLLDGDRLYLQMIHGSMASRAPMPGLVVALDKLTGDEIWRHQRQSDAVRENLHSYASPTLYRDDEREFLLTHGADYIVAHDLDTGDELWRCGGLNPRGEGYNDFLRFVSSPVAVDGLIVVPTAKRGPVLGLRPDGTGNITGDRSAYHWRLDRGTPDVPSPLVHDGLVYLCGEYGDHSCLDARTGEVVYLHRADERRRHRASPVYADGHVYYTARDGGRITVLKAGRKHEIVAVNDMGEPISSSPAIANGRIYVRTQEALYAIGE